MHLVGQVAPLFEAQSYNPTTEEIETSTLESLIYKRKWTLLFFYPLSFSGVCPTEMKALEDLRESFEELNCEILAVSVDSSYTHKAWIENELKSIKFKFLSDLKKRMARDYGVLDEDSGVALRGTFLIDPEGHVQYHLCHNLKTARNIPEILQTLKALQSPNACMANWNYE